VLPETVSAAADVSARLVIPEVVRVVAVVSAKVLVPVTFILAALVAARAVAPVVMNVVAVVPAREVFPVTFRVAIDMSVQLMAPVTCRLVAETEPRLLAPVTERFEAVVEAKVVAPDTASEVALVALKLATLVAPDKVKFPAVSVRFPVGRVVVPKVLAPVTVSADAVVLARAVAPETDNEVARVVLKLATLVAPNKIRFPPASVRFPVGRWVVPKVLAPVTVSADAVVLAREVAPETDNDVAWAVLKLATLVAPGCILSVTLNRVSTPVALHQPVRSAHVIKINVKMRLTPMTGREGPACGRHPDWMQHYSTKSHVPAGLAAHVISRQWDAWRCGATIFGGVTRMG